MGSYGELYISNFPISVTNDEIDPFLLSIFLPEDIRTFKRKIGERYQLLYGREDDSEEIEKVVQYVNTVKNICDRLNVMGFTLNKVNENFMSFKKESVERLNELIFDSSFNRSKSLNERLESDKSILENSSLGDFLQASKEIIVQRYGFDIKREEVKTSNPIITYLLEDRYGLDKFPYGYDKRTLLRALIEISSPEDIITYDITEIVKDGYYEDNPELIYEEVIGNHTHDFEIGEKYLILTEGTSDIHILRNALQILFPHLVGFYSFMDFGISNASGSASALVASIKSFVGADIKNKVIALFDNDTAAESAIKGLSKTTIPKNIKIKRYPDFKALENYPTIGPTGITNMDINGLAGSIEMYLGKDVLTENKKLIPIQWKGYDSSLKKYQGEIINKRKIHKKFEQKIKTCLCEREQIRNYDWSGLKELLRMIFNTFNE